MKINFVSITLNIGVLLFISATFFLPYESLFFTRIAVIVFSIIYLIIEVKKGYFTSKKKIFLIFSVMSMLAIIVSISIDYISMEGTLHYRIFLTPVYIFILIMLMHKDLEEENHFSD